MNRSPDAQHRLLDQHSCKLPHTLLAHFPAPLEADSWGNGASSTLDCGGHVAAERQRAATSLFLLTGWIAEPSSPHGTVASQKQSFPRRLTGSPRLQPHDARSRLVALPRGQSIPVAAKRVAGALSWRRTPVATTPAAKDCIFKSQNNKHLYESHREVSQDDDITAVPLCSSLSPFSNRAPEAQLLRRQRRWSASHTTLLHDTPVLM